MGRCVNSGKPINHGSVFMSLPSPDGGGGGDMGPEFDGEPLCEVCAEVDGVAMWVTPFILLDSETQETVTKYLDPLGQEITGTVVLSDDPKNCME